jgi:hypothetical protein
LDFVQYTAKAYNLLLMLVDLILGAFFGPFRFVVILAVVAVLAGIGLLVWLRRAR